MAIEEWKAAATSLAVREIELSKIIKQSFYSILILKQKEKLLLQTDTVYAEFLKKANLRLATGESNILEKASAESMQGAIHLQLKSIQQDVEMELLKFQLLLNTEDDIMPTSSVLKMNQTSIFDSISFQNHPTLNYFKHQQLLASDATNLERARLLPEISIGYFNTSIKGNGADNVFYTRTNRFKSVQFSIGIPLFFKSQQYRIKASNIQQLMANNNFQNHYNEIKKDLKMAWLQYENNLRMVNYYEQTALPNASLITTTAQQQFTNGQINYLEWVMLMNQSVTIQNNYLDAIKSLNESIISIEYLTSK
jgi:cobalt-zinc-cadmium resistance protein CzcA